MADRSNSLDAKEEEALRAVRREFAGFPGGKYFNLQQEEGSAAAYSLVRKDFPIFSTWSDQELEVTLDELGRSASELLIYSPFGPFIVLSSIAIFRDGLVAWDIPPCREYTAICANWSPWLPFPLPFALPF